jgi:hypothetical protein
MKAVVTTSFACAAASLIGVIGLSAVTVAPEQETIHLALILLVGLLLAAWLRLAFWARARLRSSLPGPAMSQRLRTVVVIGGVVYILFVLLCSVG